MLAESEPKREAIRLECRAIMDLYAAQRESVTLATVLQKLEIQVSAFASHIHLKVNSNIARSVLMNEQALMLTLVEKTGMPVYINVVKDKPQ